MYGNYGRRSPSPMRNQSVGAIRRGGSRLIGFIPPPPPPPPQSEPDRDEAFVQETGIKVYQSTPERGGQADDSTEDSDNDSDSEEDDEEENCDDECYEIMDDAIMEEDNEDDESSDGNEETEDKAGDAKTTGGLKQQEEANRKAVIPPKESLGVTYISGNKSSSGVSSNGSESSSASMAYSASVRHSEMTPVKIDESVQPSQPLELKKEDSMEGKEGGMSRSSSGSSTSGTSTSNISQSSVVKISKNLSSSLKGLNKLPTTTPTPTPQSGTVSAHTTPTKEPSDFLARGNRQGRMSLPLRSRFSVRPSNIQDSVISSGQTDARNKELRPTRIIWFRRGNKSLDSGTSAGGTSTVKTQQNQQAGKTSKEDASTSVASSGGDDSSLAPQTRPRSGTWSLASSRRNKKERMEREEEARQRVRRNSGDDIHRLGNGTSPSGGATTPFRRRGDGGGLGFFDSFRPRSKSDAKAILQARQRIRSGDDSQILNSSRESPKDRTKKDASPGLFDSIRPRSKSDAARLANKKSNFMSNFKQAVQHSLVSPGGTRAGGRRSGENTPPLDPRAATGAQGGATGDDYHHYTWHAGGDRPKSSLFKVFDMFRSNTDEKRRKPSGKGERGRRNSGDLHDRSRHSSGSLSSVYIRGSMNPDIVAGVFRDARKLPVVDPKIINLLSEEDESQILVKFFKLHHSYDLIPTSAKLVIFDTSLQVKKAFYALVHNGVRAAPLWDHTKQQFVGMLTITDFIRILQSFHHNSDAQMSDLEDHRLHMWRTMLKDEDKPLITITPDESLFEAISSLIRHKIHRLPVIDPATGNVLYIITHKRILKFLFLYIRELPKPSILCKTIGELNIGTYDNIETARPSTLIIEALDKFVERRISALPIVDDDGVLIDIYAKFDVLNLAAEGTYHQLDVTLSKANESRNEWFEGVLYCTRAETLNTVMSRIVNAEVHRLVVVDEAKKVVGVLSLSDILNEIVMKPANNIDILKKATVGDTVTDSAIDALKTLDIQSDTVVTTTELEDVPPVEELVIPPVEVILSEEPVEGVSTPSPPIVPVDAVSPPPPEVIGGVKGVSPIDSEDEGRYSMDKSEESPPPSTET